jgi:hypothetical protein
MAQNRLITDLVELIQPGNDDLLVIVDNTTDPTLSTTKKITYANLVEDLQDMVDLLIAEGNGIIASYSDVGNTITLSVSGDTTIQKSIYSSGGTSIGTRQQLNFIPGAGVTLTGADNPGNNRVDLTVNTTTVATGVTLSGTGSPVSPLESITTLGNGTKQLNFRGVKAGSDKLSVNTGDGGNTIVVDVVPSGIDINTLNVGSPLALALGGTNATTAADARANLGAAQLGVNNDITSIVGLTTPLSIAQGGTNGGTVQLALRNLEGIRTVANIGTAGQSLVVNPSTLVSNSYRAELKGIRAGSSKITVTTVGNDISVDANAILILNSATEDINFNDNKITSLAAPSASSDAANKGYVDAVAQGLVVKEAVTAATTTDQAGTYVASGLTFTYTATGIPSIDSLPITATGTRVLFKNQTAGSQNGIYALTTSGNTGVSAVFTRADDYNSSLEASAGSFAFVLSGATNANKQFVQTTLAPVLGTDPLVFTVLNDLTIANGSVTNAKLADMPALRVKGAVTSGVPQDLTADQLITVVNSSASQIDSARINLTPIAGDIVVNASGVSSISSGVIVNADISPTAEIAVSKLADGIARQLLQTSADGNEVEWASDIVVPGTFGVTGSSTFSGSTVFASGVVVSGSASFSGTTTAPTLASGNASSNVATTQFVATALAGITGGAVASADRLTTARAITLSGGVTGTVNFDGSSNVAIAATVATNANLTGDITSVGNATVIASGVIVNADINASAGIVDTKLATIATAGKVSNSATTAATTNTPSAIVTRDASGNFAAGTITANLTGTASNVTTNANLTGDITSVGNATSIAAGVIVNADIKASAGIVDTKLATIATAGKVSNSATTAASINTAGAIVARDGSGNFSAGTITAALTGNASTATTASTVTTNANLTGDITSVGNATAIAAGVIVNADIKASAAIAYSKLALTGSVVNADIKASAGIVDTKLATIATAGKVSNSATTATSANTASAIVARDGSGNFSAGTVTASLAGTATDCSRSVLAGTGLTGGGALSANRTIAADLATQAQAEAGSSSTKLMTPQRTAQALLKLPAYTITTTAISKTLINRERCTVTAAGLTITLPASPTAGSEVAITVVAAITNTIIARNGQNIMSLAENLTINRADVTVTFYYVDATRGWRII